MSNVVLGPKLGILINANKGDEFVDQFRPFLRAIDALIMPSVLSSTVTVTPASPSNGDAYLVPNSGVTGDWSTYPNQIAVWSTEVTTAGTDTKVPDWDYYIPKEGFQIWDASTSSFKIYTNGDWTTLSTGNFTSSTAGLVPASGGGTTKFLRADGTFAIPPATAALADPGSNGLLKRTGLNTTAIATAVDIPSIAESQVTNLVTDLASKVSTSTLSALNTGILRVTNGTGVLTTAIAADFPTLNQNTTGTAAGLSANIAESQVTNLVNDLAAKAPLNSPTFTTPTLGVASATSINKVTITAPSTSATLTLAQGSSLVTVGAYSVTLTATSTTNITLPVTGTLATTAQMSLYAPLLSPTLTTPVLGVATATSINNLTFTQPASGATLTLANGSTLATVGAYSVTLTATAATNVTLPTSGTLATTTQLAGLAPLVSPSFTTPSLNSATASSINKVTITAPATGSTLTLADGSTLATSGAFSLTLTTTGATNVTFPTSGTLATNAVVTSGAAGLAPASGGGTSNFLRADGTWAAPAVSNPLFTTSTSGIVPASGGGSVNFLRADGVWAAQAGGGGITTVAHDTSMAGDGNGTPLNLGAFQSKTAGYTMLVTDYSLVVDSVSPTTVTLTVSGASVGKTYRVKNSGTGVVTVQGASGSIDGAATATLSAQYQSADFVFDGTNFWVF